MNKIKIATASLGTLAVVGSITGIAVSQVLKNKKDNINSFKTVSFNDKSFNSKEEVLKYIQNNSSRLEKSVGSNIFSVNVGSDTLDFDEYSNAIDFIKKRILTDKVFIKPSSIKGASKEVLDESIPLGLDSIIKVDDTRKVIAFQKYSHNIDNPNINHSFTYALLPKKSDPDSLKTQLNIKIDEARREAAESYLQVHSAYFFDNVYFKTINDLRSYLMDHSDKSYIFNKVLGESGSTSKYFALNTKRGQIRFEEDSNLKENKVFKKQIRQLSVPYFNDGTKDSPNWIPINQTTSSISGIKNAIQSNIDSNNLEYIKVNQNEGETTQVVDMDSSTPNGNIFGNYFIKTGATMDGVDDVSNWTKVDDSKLSNNDLTGDIKILNSILDYVLITKGITSLNDLLSITTLKNDTNKESFIDFLSKPRFRTSRGKYIDIINDFILTISKGSRYNFLNSLIGLHSFLINKMIQDKMNSQDIITVSKYFDSLTKVMDANLAPLIMPFFTSEKENSFTFDYISSAFSFYRENLPGKGIEFQNNPFSYYAKLTGHVSSGGETNDISFKRKTYFKLLKAAMGLNSIMLAGMKYNQDIFSGWENQMINNILDAKTNSSNPYIEKLSFSKDDKPYKKIWDFTFKGSNTINLNAREYISIWKNIESIKVPFELDDGKLLDKKIFIKNYNKYIVNYQNNIIDKYLKNIDKKMDTLVSRFLTGSTFINPQTKKSQKIQREELTNEAIKNYFNTNLNDFITLDPSTEKLANSNITIASSYDGYTKLNKMIEDAVKPIEERIKDFIVKAGTIAVKIGIAAVSAGAAVEEMAASDALANSVKSLNSKSNYLTKSFSSRKNINLVKRNYKKEKVKKFIKKIITDKDLSDSSPIYNYVNKHIDGKTLDDLISSDDKFAKKIIDDAISVSISIARNVIPGLNSLIGIFSNFNHSEKQVYKFSKLEDNSNLYWDGGLVEYSWWGLYSNQKYSIADLKMLKPLEIISGYGSSTPQYYYGNSFHDSLDALKYQAANDIIEKVGTYHRTDISNQKMKKISWYLPLENESISNKTKMYQTIDELIINMATIAKETNFPKRVYKSPTGLVFGSSAEAFNKSVENLINSLKKVLLIKLPQIDKGNITSEEEFILPFPYYDKQEVIRDKTQNKLNLMNDDYIVFNPNISWDSDDELSQLKQLGFNSLPIINGTNEIDKNSDEYKKAINLLLTMRKLSISNDFSNLNSLKLLVDRFSKNIYVPNKEVIFEEVNHESNLGYTSSMNEKVIPGSYESLDDSWTKESKFIYEIKTKEGKVMLFRTKEYALKELMKEENFLVDIINMGRTVNKYEFNNILFNSINEIYKYIIKMNNKGEN